MGIGVGLFLVAAGAVLTFAVNTAVSGVNINAVGVILMIVGGLGIMLDLLVLAPRRRSVTTYTSAAPAPAAQVTSYEV